LRTGTWLATILGAACFAQNGPGSPSNGAYQPDKVMAVTPINQRPDANKLREINLKRLQSQHFAAANVERKRQMSADSARLVQIATELNEELAKAGEGGLAPAALARAGMIEELARAVKDKMKLTVAAQ
jgi:hypothetical protein